MKIKVKKALLDEIFGKQPCDCEVCQQEEYEQRVNKRNKANEGHDLACEANTNEQLVRNP